MAGTKLLNPPPARCIARMVQALRIVAALCCLCMAVVCRAAEDTETAVLDPAFRTLRVEHAGGFMLPPVVQLGTDERVVVSFDEIGDDFSQLQYSLTHCNADWQPSQLLESEYLEGFNIADVEDYAYSSNTFIHFVNYRIEVPSDDMRPLVSGNYLLRVFDRDDPDTVLLQARFSVTEGRVTLSGNANGRTDRGFNSQWQQVDFTVSAPNFEIADPFRDLRVTVMQNNTPSTQRTLTRPLRISGSDIVFDHSPELIFDAGNEFRRFETIRTNYPGMHVDSMRYVGPGYHAYLMADRPRAWHDYVFDATQRGRFKIREYSATDPDLGADYVTVHFTLEAQELPGVSVYVDGDMTQHRLSRSNRMDYDRSVGAYTLELPLKQGSYNYRYVAVPPGGGAPTPSLVEGDKFETINEYLLQVFYRPPGARADRLIGHGLMVADP